MFQTVYLFILRNTYEAKRYKSKIPEELEIEWAFGNSLRYKVAWATFLLFLVRGGYCEIIGLERGFKECPVYPFIKNKGSRAYGFLFSGYGSMQWPVNPLHKIVKILISGLWKSTRSTEKHLFLKEYGFNKTNRVWGLLRPFFLKPPSLHLPSHPSLLERATTVWPVWVWLGKMAALLSEWVDLVWVGRDKNP